MSSIAFSMSTAGQRAGLAIHRLCRACFALVLLWLVGCVAAGPELGAHDGSGTVRLALRSTGPDGAVYRLRSAHLGIAGPTPATIETEDDPDATLPERALEPGSYTLTLADGWFLERSAAGGAFARVEAERTSPNPVSFTVLAGMVSDVRLSFRVAGADVVMEPGGVRVGVDITLEDAGRDAGHDAGAAPEPPPVDVLTRGYDPERSNANLHESVLNTANVRPTTFGKLFELPVDDQVYAQILHVSNLSIGGVVRDVLYVATVNNTLYAFDADVPGPPLWSRNFNGTGRPTRNSEVGQNCNPYRDFSGNIGVVGTPVIDRAAGTLYVVTRVVDGGGATRQHLRSLDITTGENKGAGSVLIEASVPGTGAGAAAGALAFQPSLQNQRLGLGLSQGHVYIGWSGFCDTGSYHGWVMAYEGATLLRTGVLNTTPNGASGGVWQAGAAPLFDGAGNVYLGTGNGSYDGVKNLGETVLKLAPKTLQVLDHFAPANWNALNGADLDLGSAGPSWIAGTNLLVLGGKEGKVYLLRSSSLGGSITGDTQIPQSFQLVDPATRPSATHHLHAGVAMWEGPAGLHMYAAGENDYVRAFRFNRTTNTFQLPATLRGDVLPPVGMPGGMITLSADGSRAGTGIVWVTTPRSGDANQNVTPGILRAYNAETLALLWDSGSPGDDISEFAKFNNPTVAEGKVYVASFSRAVHVFGLRRGQVVPPVNLALNKPVTSPNTPCVPSESADKLTDGQIYAQSEADKFKWCTHGPGATARIDLGTERNINRIVVHHAGEGGESISYNTRAFRLLAGTSPSFLPVVATVTNNTLSKTEHTFAPISARYVQLNVDSPAQSAEDGTRIYEIEVFGP